MLKLMDLFNQLTKIDHTHLQMDVIQLRQAILSIMHKINNSAFLKLATFESRVFKHKIQQLEDILEVTVQHQGTEDKERLLKLSEGLHALRICLAQELESRDLYLQVYKPLPEELHLHLREALLIKINRRDLSPWELAQTAQCLDESLSLTRCEVKDLLKISDMDLHELELECGVYPTTIPVPRFSISQVMQLITLLANSHNKSNNKGYTC